LPDTGVILGTAFPGNAHRHNYGTESLTFSANRKHIK